MTTYRRLYFMLFNALSDAIEDLEAGHVITAILRMQQAQQTAECLHMEQDIVPEDVPD